MKGQRETHVLQKQQKARVKTAFLGVKDPSGEG